MELHNHPGPHAAMCVGWIWLLSPCASSLFFSFFLFFCTNLFVTLSSKAQESVTGCSATAPGASGAWRRPPLAPRLGWLRSGCVVALGGTMHRYLFGSYGSSCGRGHVGRMGLKAASFRCRGPLLPGSHHHPMQHPSAPAPSMRHRHPAWVTSTQCGSPAPGTGHWHPAWATRTPTW